MTEISREIDEDGLRSFLTTELGVDVTGMKTIHDGLNLSIAISTSDMEPAYVLRRPNKLRHTESFNEIHQEYGVMKRLQETNIPTPDPVLLCEDEELLGEPFLVMKYLDGEVIPLGSNLPERFQNQSARNQIATRLIDTLAELHSVSVEPFRDICDYESTADQVSRVVNRLKTTTKITGHEPPAIWDIADWLEQNVPTESEMTLIHGDYRPGNVLFGKSTPPKIVGVIDWETAFLGDPFVELGYLLLRWRDEGDSMPNLDALKNKYSNPDALETLRKRNNRGLAPFTNQPGSPSRKTLIRRYEKQTGYIFQNDRFYRAFAAFVLTSVWEDLYRYQVEAGIESNREPHIDYMAMLAKSIISENK